MPAPKNISHLSEEEQAKLLRKREQARTNARKRRGTDPNLRPRVAATDCSNMSQDERAAHKRRLVKESSRKLREADPESWNAKSIAAGIRIGAEMKELRRIQRSGERPLSLPERLRLGAMKLCSLKNNQKNGNKNKEARRQRFQDPEVLRKHAENSAKWREENREKNNANLKVWRENKKATDPCYKLQKNLRATINWAVKAYAKGAQKGGSAVKDLGCTLEELSVHLEKQFSEGMTWDNYGSGSRDNPRIHFWTMDHVICLRSFDLTDPEQFKIASHYTNLAPLWYPDNVAKSDYLLIDGVKVRARTLRTSNPCADNDQELDEAA
jgi:hypothetical protein